MADVDALMDVVQVAVEATFGRAVTYTPVGAPSVSTLPDGSDLCAVWTAAETSLSPATAAHARPNPTLDFRTASLTLAGITPRPGDVVAFTVLGEAREYRVTELQPSDEGSTVLALAGRA